MLMIEDYNMFCSDNRTVSVRISLNLVLHDIRNYKKGTDKTKLIPNILEVAVVRKSRCFSFQVGINQVLNLEFPARQQSCYNAVFSQAGWKSIRMERNELKGLS